MAIGLPHLYGFSKIVHCCKSVKFLIETPHNISHHTLSMLPHCVWKLYGFYGKFSSLFGSERILKIGRDLTKLPNEMVLWFFWTQFSVGTIYGDWRCVLSTRPYVRWRMLKARRAQLWPDGLACESACWPHRMSSCQTVEGRVNRSAPRPADVN